METSLQARAWGRWGGRGGRPRGAGGEGERIATKPLWLFEISSVWGRLGGSNERAKRFSSSSKLGCR